MIPFDGNALPVLRLALATTADATEQRKALHGVFLDPLNGRLVATDGHRLFMAALPPGVPPLSGPLILRFINPATGAPARKLPASWAAAVLDREALVLRGLGLAGGTLPGELRLEVLSEDFPDVDRILIPILAALPSRTSGTAQITLDPTLLAQWSLGKNPALALTIPGDPHQCLVVTIPALAVPHLGVLMGVNIPAQEPRQCVGTLIPSQFSEQHP